MTIPIEFVALFLGVSLAIAGWIIRYMLSVTSSMNLTLTGISEDVAAMNSRMASMEAWAKAHEKLDDQNFLESRQDRRDIWSAVRRKE